MSIGAANKMQHLQRSWTLPNDSKHTEAGFSAILTDTLYLRVAQMPRSPDLAIFVLTDNDDSDYITPCACARGNNIPWPAGLMGHLGAPRRWVKDRDRCANI